jgi:hypothetical protein
MLRVLWKLIRAILIVIVVVIAVPVLGLAYGWMTTSDVDTSPLPGLAESAPPADLALRVRNDVPGYQRPEESTFLTYPEWAIVYAAREYAGFVANHRESGFPYWAHIGRFWRDYATMIRATANYPFNSQNHLMLVVIGTSHTIEHAIQSIYENTVGRLTELASGLPTPQDRYQAEAAADYAAFLDQVPWYQFPYADKRAGLWATESEAGAARLRSWERKLSFGLAYTIKQGYADLIKSGLAATADPAFLDIVVWAKGPVATAVASEPNTNVLLDLSEDGTVFVTRRYQVFTDMVPRLIRRGVSFVEIGGNDEILVTVLSGQDLDMPEGSRPLFAYDLPAEPDTRRTGLVASVRALHTVVPQLAAQGVTLEHIYDY